MSKDHMASTVGHGDRVDIDKVLVRSGENFAYAIAPRGTPSYQGLTADARAKVWNAVFGHFKKQATDQLGDELVVKPEVFAGSRYGSPIKEPSLLTNTVKAAETLGDASRPHGVRRWMLLSKLDRKQSVALR